ncbi:hypothetical protein GFK27_24205, partial [Salmonella enterica subsp. enterica serovar Enteritidis]|nr:hypothetical protein [Salmonella enterica subsp. enterica serovar Enteritidis]
FVSDEMVGHKLGEFSPTRTYRESGQQQGEPSEQKNEHGDV